MKALFVWLDGPFADRSVRIPAGSIPLGPCGADSLEIPGHTGSPWALIEFEAKHFYVVERDTPGGLFVNDEAAERGRRIEIKSGTVVRFGTGPRFRFGFEIEPQDLLVHTAGPEYDPSEAMRRMQAGLAHSGAQRRQVDAVQRNVQASEKRNLRRWGGAVLIAVVAALVGVGFTYVVMKRQEATERKVQQLARATSRFETEARAADEAFRRAMAATPSTQSEAKRRLDELEAQLQRPDADPSLAAERDRFRALLEGLPGREAALQRAYEKAVASLLFLYVEWDYEVAGVRRTRSGMGTGFVVDRRGWVVTAKHVVHPWKYQKFHLDLRREGIREWRRVGEPRIFAFRAADRFELRDDALHSPARWSSEAGTLSVLRLEDDLRMTEVGEIEPGYSNDVAILGLRGDLPPPLELAPPEEIAPDRLRPLTPILIAGFPLGSTAFERQEIVPQPTLGHIRKVEIFISHSVPTCSGNSGGPVLAENGRVIGLVNATLAGQNINLSLSAARIRELLPRD